MKEKSIKHWIVVGLLSVMAASSVGLCQNAVGVFYTPVSESLGVMRGTFALHATLSSFATAICSLFVPKLIKQVSYKGLLGVGMVLAGVSTCLMSTAHSVMIFYLLGIIRGIGASTFALVPITMIITKWFQEKHGLATSIALSFSGLSGAFFSPLLTNVITHYGWQTAYIVQGVCIILLPLPALLFPWTIEPKDSGLLSYGYHEETEKKYVLQSSTFRFTTLSFLCMCFFTVMHTSITGISQHFTGMTASVGLSASVGALMMSLAMCGNIITKLLIGILSDKTSPIQASITMICVNMASLLLLFTGVKLINVPFLLISALIYGSIYSVGAVGIPLMTRYFFGSENYAKAYSRIGFLTSVGSASSLTLIGYVYDFTAGYSLVVIAALCMHVCNLCLLSFINHRHKKDMAK